jgi:hypothetical protein
MEVDEENLENELLSIVGARVMFTSNLWINAGLVNVALGVVEPIVYNPRTSPLEPPTYVLIRFNNYVGVPWDKLFHKIMSIIPNERGKYKQTPL